LNGNLHMIGVAESKLCPSCEMEEETSLHFLGKCDRYVVTRCDVLESQFLGAEDVRQATPTSLCYISKVLVGYDRKIRLGP